MAKPKVTKIQINPASVVSIVGAYFKFLGTENPEYQVSSKAANTPVQKVIDALVEAKAGLVNPFFLNNQSPALVNMLKEPVWKEKLAFIIEGDFEGCRKVKHENIEWLKGNMFLGRPELEASIDARIKGSDFELSQGTTDLLEEKIQTLTEENGALKARIEELEAALKTSEEEKNAFNARVIELEAKKAPAK